MTAVARRRARRPTPITRATSGGRSRRCRCRAHLPIAGELTYRYGPDEVDVEDGRFATERTVRHFERHDRVGRRSRMPFHVTSGDWQESDQVLAGIITRLRVADRPVAVRRPRRVRRRDDRAVPRVRASKATFTGEDLRAFDTLWGDGGAHIVVENSYVNVTRRRRPAAATRRSAPTACSRSAIRARMAARRSNARIRVARRDLDSLRHAFGIDDYPVSGLLSGEFHLTGEYQRPVGFGGMTIDDGVAYGEPFEKATASLRFDGTGVRLDGVDGREGRRHDHRRRVRRLGRDLLVQRRRPAHSGRADRRARVSARAAVGPRRVHRRAAAARSTRRATTSGSASTICSSAKRASARSPARWRCAAPS